MLPVGQEPGNQEERSWPGAECIGHELSAKVSASCLKACSEAARPGNEVYLFPADPANRAVSKWKVTLNSRP